MIYDAAIIGAGCAGRHLAVELRLQCPDLKVVLIDAREDFPNDRTWSFWHPERRSTSSGPAPFWESAIRQRWPSWQVQQGMRTIRRSAPGMAYVSLPAQDFYHATEAVLGGQGGPDRQYGRRVSDLVESSDEVAVQTSGGKLVARYVFDSRPLPVSATNMNASPAFSQVFTGFHLRTQRPCWSPETAELMRFVPGPAGTIAFVYTLPSAPDAALVEVTWFVPAGSLERPEASDVMAHLASAHALGAGDFTILATEGGTIPMDPKWGVATCQSKRIFAIGTRSGAIRPSTGYGFLAMASHAQKIARHWQQTGRPCFIPHRSGAWRALDTIFLAALHRSPHLAPEWIVDLFEKTPPGLLVRFLQEEASPFEVMRLMAALPTAPFLRAALRQLPTLWRQ